MSPGVCRGFNVMVCFGGDLCLLTSGVLGCGQLSCSSPALEVLMHIAGTNERADVLMSG